MLCIYSNRYREGYNSIFPPFISCNVWHIQIVHDDLGTSALSVYVLGTALGAA